MRKPTPFRAATLLTAILAGALALAAVAPAHDDDDRFQPEQEAGTIASFDEQTDVLTVDLAEGGTVSGTVTRLTWIKCDDRPFSRSVRRHLSGGEHGDDDDHGWHRWRCSTAALTEGAVVEEALMSLRDGEAFFWKIELDD
jgi:hypothetical protein